ncbi:MAG: hypothetical protein WDN69_18685 [Aliidongia sp.]
MNPWGLLDEPDAGPERRQLEGARLSGAQVKAAVQVFAAGALRPAPSRLPPRHSMARSISSPLLRMAAGAVSMRPDSRRHRRTSPG